MRAASGSAQGLKVGDIKHRFGAEGNGPSIYLTDPEGNTVELKVLRMASHRLCE